MQFAPAEPFPNRPPRFRRHRRQGIDPKFFDSWSRNGVLRDRSCDDAFPSAKVLNAPCSHATEQTPRVCLQDVGDLEAVFTVSLTRPRSSKLIGYDCAETTVGDMVAIVDDSFDLDRFVSAQNPVYDRVCAELCSGRKSSHWMWFIFPQLRGLGSSAMAEKFGIASRAKAQAYLDHPVLGSRLRECTALANQIQGRAIEQIFGYPDDLKFRSSMTLFASVAPGDQVFKDALEKYFGGESDTRTLDLLR